MKHNAKRKLFLDLTLDSSEAVMFSQGGKHKMEMCPEIFENIDLVEISFQIEKREQARYDHVSGRKTE